MERTVIIHNSSGLHARPAAILVKKASIFPCEISLGKAGKKANAKSVLSVLALGVSKNDRILLSTVGDKAAEALQSIGDLLESLEG